MTYFWIKVNYSLNVSNKECYWKILVCLPQPESSHSRISLAKGEEGCDQQAVSPDLNNSGRSVSHLSLFHPGQSITSKSWALAHVLNFTGQGDILYIKLVLTCNAEHLNNQSHRSWLLLQLIYMHAWLGVISEESDYSIGTPQPSRSVSLLNIIVCCFQHISWLLYRLYLCCVLWPTISLNHRCNAGVIQRNDCFAIFTCSWATRLPFKYFDRHWSETLAWVGSSTWFQILWNAKPQLAWRMKWK